MSYKKTEAAKRAGKATIPNLFYERNNNTTVKQKPEYYSDLLPLINSGQFIIAVDWNSFNFIQKLNGMGCLLCEDNPHSFDLSLCKGKEPCVAFSSENYCRANELAKIILHAGAKKIFLTQINIQTFGGRHE